MSEIVGRMPGLAKPPVNGCMCAVIEDRRLLVVKEQSANTVSVQICVSVHDADPVHDEDRCGTALLQLSRLQFSAGLESGPSVTVSMTDATLSSLLLLLVRKV